MEHQAKIIERGNGFPSPGYYCPGHAMLWRVVAITSPIHTGQPGDGDYIYATVEDADWDDCAEEDEFRAEVEIQ